MAKQSKPTVSLQMIVKDEVEKVDRLVSIGMSAFDEVYLTVSDKAAFNKLTKNFKDYRQVHVDYRAWNDNFADARNHNFSLSKCDYQFWLDSDDSFDFSYIEELLDLAATGGYEAIYLPYDYARDETGRTVAVHWRERLIKRSSGFQWRGALHETLIIDRQFTAKRLEQPVIIHDSPNIGASIERNHKILLKEAEKDPVDPRILHYLGLSYFTMGDYRSCLKVLSEYIKVGGWDEEIYRSLMKMSEAAGLLDMDEDARNYALQAAGVLPNYPNAYYALANLEFVAEQWPETLEWLRVAFDKPLPNTMSVVDPTIVERGKIIGACAEFQLGHYQDAVDLLKKANDPAVEKLLPNFEFEASKQRFIDIAPAVTKHVDEKKLYEGLAEDLKYDPRMKWLREAVVKPKKWPKNSIVFFCGQGYEEWGPHTLDKGMGGSEEAVVYLSRELATLGFDVTIYGAVVGETVDWVKVNKNGDQPNNQPKVMYLPWRMFDTRDEFDTLVVWRAPHGVDKLKARVKILDMHDKLESKDVVPYDDVTYFFKSSWHRNLYPHIDDEHSMIVGNGIVKEHFK